MLIVFMQPLKCAMIRAYKAVLWPWVARPIDAV
jgi:hypothetical protein